MSPPISRTRIRTTALIVASALFMEALDSTVLATALPDMARSLGASPTAMSVALTSYMLSLAVFIPASGKVADRFGTRRVFTIAILVFTLGSILCGQAGTLGFLVAARLLQGMGGAMMVPVGRLLLLRTVPKSEMVSAMAWFLVPALMGPVVGPPVGGIIVTHLSWHWIFYINVPMGIVGMVLVQRYIEDARESVQRPFDWIGLAVSGICLSCLIFGLEIASRGALSQAATIAVLTTGLLAGGLYLRHAKRHPAPIIDVTLLRIPTFRISVIGGSLTRISGGASPFLLPLMLQLGFGMSAEKSGAITFVGAAGSMLMKVAATPILRRFGFRKALIWNSLLASACIGAMAGFRPEWPIRGIYALLLASGFFQSLQFTAYNTIAYAEVEPERMSDATSFYSTMQQMMLSMGICVAATVLEASVALSGHHKPELADFSVAFLTVAAVSMLASPACSRLQPTAGDEIAGRAVHSGMR